MPRPKASNTGKVTSLRTDLESFRRNNDRERFEALIDHVIRLYKQSGSIKGAAQSLGVGKRTLERVAHDFPELGEAIARTRDALALLR